MVKRQNRTGGVSDCVAPEMLASYVDGTINATGHGDVEAHLADCDVCREIAAEAALAREGLGAVAAGRPTSVWFLKLASRDRRIWPTVGILAAAAAVTLAIVIPRLMRPADPSARPELAELVAAVGEHRPFEPRLTGGFRYGPLAPVYRSGEGGAAEVRPEVVAAAARLELAAVSGSNAKNLAAKAAGLLVMGRAGDAIQALEYAVTLEPGRAAYWSDLSAAHLVRAQRDGDLAAAEKGLAAADTALALAPGLLEALFNRALALEALGREPEAKDAWQAAASDASANPWAAESRRRAK